MQRDRATRFVSRNNKSDLQVHFRSLVFVTFYAIHDFLLILYCNYVFSWHRFRDIIAYFANFQDVI